MSKNHYILGLSSFSSKKNAKDISHELVKQGIAACVNIIYGVDSIYSWNNKIIEEKEIIILIKTLYSNQEKVKKFIKEHHKYKNPELIFFSVDTGLEDYLKWIKDSIK